MTLAGRSVVTVDDLTNGEIESLFSLTDEMSASITQQMDVCRGKIMASLFFEPSTRTRLSFEAAMHRLGGSVITAMDVGATSLAKGESIADMARVVGSYADIIVIRHPWEGAARVVAQFAGVPVINAGDGGHEHPTQTLLDLYTLKKERRSIKGLKIALWGDLKYGRTVHSLACALARFGAVILFRPAPGMELPEHVMRKLAGEYKGQLKRYETSAANGKGTHFAVDAIYVTPQSPHQLAMMPDVDFDLELEGGVDALYVTRAQKERHASGAEKDGEKKGYPVVDRKLLKEREFRDTLVMHPLPRVDELAREIDADPRSLYFKQAALGVPVRMSLISLLLGVKEAEISEAETFGKSPSYPLYQRDYGVRCHNPRCVAYNEANYVMPEFHIIAGKPLTFRCAYCEHETYPRYVASTEWHNGTIAGKRFHSSDSHWARKIKAENLIAFDSASEALARGFKPGRYID